MVSESKVLPLLPVGEGEGDEVKYFKKNLTPCLR